MVPAAVTLRPEPASVREARRFVARRLADGGFDAAVFTAELLVSELVTNAILHARTDITLSVDLHGDVARVSVADASPRSVLRRQHSVESGTGRGLVLVDRMAPRWGIDKTVGGKCVWFELPAAPPADAWDALEA